MQDIFHLIIYFLIVLILFQTLVLIFVIFYLFYEIFLVICVFFFSSRRRHTRYIGDWSSDVCSSDLEERMYAAGKIPGSSFKREGRAGEKGTLTARMIDRPIRPLFPKGWRRETQLVAIPMSVDHVHPYDILAMNGASAALMLSDIPFPMLVGSVRIGQDEEGGFVVNPEEEWLPESPLDLVVAGSEDAILMVEAGAQEVSEAEILDALDIAHSEIKKLCEAQRELQKKAGKEKSEIEVPQVDEAVLAEISDRFGAALDTATQVED